MGIEELVAYYVVCVVFIDVLRGVIMLHARGVTGFDARSVEKGVRFPEGFLLLAALPLCDTLHPPMRRDQARGNARSKKA
jgi:hypothetical protein